MPLRQSKQQRESESSGLLSSVRGRVQNRTGTESSTAETDQPSGWLGRARAKYGLGALLVGLGIVLVLIPEPATSTAGFIMIAVGAIMWIAGWAR